MAPRTQTDGGGKPLDNEPLPPIDDDGDITPPARTQRARTEDDGEGDDNAAPSLRRGDAAREDITKRYRELQSQERSDDPPPATNEDPDFAPPRAAIPEVTPRDDDQELTLTVYGERLKRKRSELIEAYQLEGLSDEHIIRVAQKEIAADQRLREAKEAADQRLAGSHRPSTLGDEGDGDLTDQSGEPRPDDANGLTPDRSPREPDQALNEEQLDEIVQRVQFGDADEAKQALVDFAGAIRKSLPAATPDEVLNQFEQRLAQRQHQTEIYDALKRFADDNPDLMEDPHLVTVGLDIAKEQMLEDLRAIPGMKDEYLAPIAHDRKAVATAHRTVRQQGHQVRSIDEVLQAAGDTMRSKFHLSREGQRNGSSQPHPANSQPGTMRERIARKELAPQQPRHGGVRVAPAQGNRPKTALEIINEKRSRGGFQPV